MQVLCVSPIYNTCGSMFSFNLTQIESTLRYTTFYNLSIFFVRPSVQSVWLFYNFFSAPQNCLGDDLAQSIQGIF